MGVCPLCQSTVSRRRTFYGCDGYAEKGCKFSVNTYICQKAISLPIIKELLEKGETSLIEGFISKKSPKPFSAKLKLDEQGKTVFCFPEKNNEVLPTRAQRNTVPCCPLCGKKVVKGKTAYGCMGYSTGCSFRLPFERDGKVLTDREAAEIIIKMASDS